MLHSNGDGRFQGIAATLGPEALLRQAVETLQRQIVKQCQPGHDDRQSPAVDEIVKLGMQPEILPALLQRRDSPEAVRDLAIRYAFAALMVQGRSFHELDPMSQVLIQQTLELIHQRAARVARRTGEHPLDEDPGLLLSLCKCLSRYVPRRPMGAHITYKLQRYEGAVSRAMRQIEYLITRPQVADAFAAYVLGAELPDAFKARLAGMARRRSHRGATEEDPESEFKARLLHMARGGGRGDVNPEAVVRFFTLPETVAFVKRFADRVQTARTLYDEQEYADAAWRGRRRLPANRRQGYLEAALASLERLQGASLDTDDYDLHELVEGSTTLRDREVVFSPAIEGWITRHALATAPDDPLWQVCELLFVQKLTPQAIVARGLASQDLLAAAQERMAALLEDPDVREAWRAAIFT
jgi:hypothetical protein